MKENCFDIGIIQAFLDGELSHEESSTISSHAALCEACARELARAEDESSVVFAALEREFDALVPTHRLWNKINDSIIIEKQNAPIWTKIWAGVRTVLVTPSLAVAASLLVILGISVAVYVNRQTAPTVSEFKPPVPSQSNPAVPAQVKEPDQVVTPSDRPLVERAAYRPDNEIRPRTAMYYPTRTLGENYLPGEESYVKTIASLSKTVDQQKSNGVLRPSERVSYEKDMAVVNDSIKKIKRAVKRDPKNETARQVLYASYQNKIDLLNSVAQREELVASLR